jgi:hypothetical protein
MLARCFNSLEFCAGGVDAPVSGSFPAVSRRTSPMRACTCAWTGLMNLESWSDRRDPLISRRSRLASEEERYVDCSYLGLNPHQERLTVRVVNVSAHQQQQQQKRPWKTRRGSVAVWGRPESCRRRFEAATCVLLLREGLALARTASNLCGGGARR